MFVELHRSRFRLFEKHYGSLYVWAVRRIVHLGLAAEARRARAAAERGDITQQELANKLAAFGEAWAL
jgi:hypothetical protein